MTQACRHCQLPCPPDAEFCCVGCEAVWYALAENGLETFYALRGGPGVPVSEPGQRAFSPEAEALADGTVCSTVGLDGLHCAGCVWLLERMPDLVDGVVDARVNLGRGRLEVRWSPDAVGFDAISRWLNRFGYSPYGLDTGRGIEQERRESKALARVGFSWALAANVMLLSVALYAGLDPVDDGGLWTGARWLAMGLAAVSLAHGGREFLRRAWASLYPFRFTRLSVDLPVSVGLVVGFVYSAYNTVLGVGEVWFDTVAVLIAALLTARWLHARGLRVAADATNRLASILPPTARLIDASGAVQVVGTSQLAAGSLVEVRTGDVVPADGIVEEGTASIDRSQLTGESAPESATVGDQVYAGESNFRGVLRVRVEAVGDETRFGRLAGWVLDAEQHNAPTVQLADRLSGWFVAAILLGAATTAAWAAMYAPSELVPRVVALLVVSCPCALGMATPLAFSVAVGRAARRGIFVRDDATFETLPDVDVVVLDKTGTLTRGATRIVDVSGGGDSARAVQLAAALERQSSHPIAAAFAAYDVDLPVTEFDEEPGYGVKGVVDGRHVVVRGGAVESDRTTVDVVVDGVVEASVTLGDTIRAQAAALVRSLESAGVQVWIASGDQVAVVDAVADIVGVESSRALGRQTPEQKLELVRRLRAEGQRVAMIGDGVNDAAALREADVGVAMGGGADLNAIACDVQLGRAGLRPIVELLGISKAAVSTVHRNLVMSVFYNVIAITAAGFGLVTPLVAAVAMPLSSLAVVASSLWQEGKRDSIAIGENIAPPSSVSVRGVTS